MPSQNLYDYKKLKTLDKFYCINNGIDKLDPNYADMLRNKINELVIEYNKTAKDFECYKKQFKQFVSEVRGEPSPVVDKYKNTVLEEQWERNLPKEVKYTEDE